MIEYFLAVDGGGTGTRTLIARPDGTQLARGEAGPSALGQGVTAAWQQVRQAVEAGSLRAGIDPLPWARCAMAIGLSGMQNPVNRAAFLALLPPMSKVISATDGYIMLLGAHAGRPGLVVAAGTGSVGEALHADGRHSVVGGWGFPVGDEGSGAWIGLNAVRHAQAAMDGRAPTGILAQRVWSHCGATSQDMAAWVARSAQLAYAQVAPLVFECEFADPTAARLLALATQELELIALALDPRRTLPVAIGGSIGERLKSRMNEGLRQRFVQSAMGPIEGALLMLQKSQR